MAGNLIEKVESIYRHLIPLLSRKYLISIKKPLVDSFSEKGNYSKYQAYFVPCGKCGVVRISEQAANSQYKIVRLAAHELGHSAIFQNNKFFYSTSSKSIDCLAEGICQDFSLEAAKALHNKRLLSLKDKLLVWLSVQSRSLSSSEEGKGTRLVRIFKSMNVPVTELILNPERFKEDISKLYYHKL